QSHLHRAAALRGDRARLLTATREPPRPDGVGGVRALPRRLRALSRDAVPVPDGRPALLRRARLRHPRTGEPVPLLDAALRALAAPCDRRREHPRLAGATAATR